MKISTNKKELIKLNACSKGLDTFVEKFGDDEAMLSQCLDNNGWDDVWWLMSESYEQFSDSQKKDIRLLACDYADTCLHLFEIKHPDDNRPRLAIKASRDFANGLIDDVARAAAWAAAWGAEAAAETAARAAAEAAARAAAGYAAGSAAGSAAGYAAGSAAGYAAGSAAGAAGSAAGSAAGEAALAADWEAWAAAARAAAGYAARAAAGAAGSAAGYAALAAGAASRKNNTDMLMKLLKKWEL